MEIGARIVAIAVGLWLAACGPHVDHPESCLCGSSIRAVDAPTPRLRMGALAPLGTSCAVDREHRLHCAYETSVPEGELAHVARDGNTVCAIYTSGRMACQVGVDAAGPPTFVDGGPFARVDVLSTHACAIRRDGTLWCSGIAEPPSGRYVDVAVGYQHACALTPSGLVRCWGEGSGACETDAPPGPYVDLSAHMTTTCGVRADGGIDCWGRKPQGRPRHRGRAVEVLVTEGEIGTNGDTVCARYDDGAIACSQPGWRMPEGAFVALARGSYLARTGCAMAEDLSVTCFGPSDDWPEGATAVVTRGAPSEYDAPRWFARDVGPFRVSLPCDATPEESPANVERTSCVRPSPAELIGLEVVHPAPEIVAAGQSAMLAFALDAKRLAFPETRVWRSNPILLGSHRGIDYQIEVGTTARMLGRAYVDGSVIYAVTGMYDATSTDAYGRIRGTIDSVEATR